MKIGVFGLSGVGKTFLVNSFIQKNKNYISTKASDLIANEKHHILLNELTFEIVDENQRALVIGFNKFCSQNTNKNIIIELHNILETPEGVVEINSDVFKELDLAFFIYRSAKDILRQRLNDPSKKRFTPTIKELALIQERALLIFKDTFSELRIDSVVLVNGELNNFHSHIQRTKLNIPFVKNKIN